MDYKTLDILTHIYELTGLQNEAIQNLDLFLLKHNIRSRHKHYNIELPTNQNNQLYVYV